MLASPTKLGHIRQTTIILSLTAHGAPPRPATVPILEKGTILPYHPLGSFNKRCQNPLGTIIKYPPCVCGVLWRRASEGRHRTCLLFKRSVRQWRQRWRQSETSANSQRYHIFVQTSLKKLVTYKQPIWGRIIFVTLCHQQLSFQRNPLPLHYVPTLKMIIYLWSNRKQSCCEGTAAWDTVCLLDLGSYQT